MRDDSEGLPFLLVLNSSASVSFIVSVFLCHLYTLSISWSWTIQGVKDRSTAKLGYHHCNAKAHKQNVIFKVVYPNENNPKTVAHCH